MDDAFGRRLLDDRDSLYQVFFCLFGRVIGYRGSNLFDRVLDPGFVAHISELSDFALSHPFKGRFVVRQVLISS